MKDTPQLNLWNDVRRSNSVVSFMVSVWRSVKRTKETTNKENPVSKLLQGDSEWRFRD